MNFLEDLRESNDLLNEQISFDNKMRKVILEAAEDKHIDLDGATIYRNKKTGKSYIYSDGKFLPVSVKHVNKDAKTLISRNYRDSGYLVKKEPKNAELKSGYDSLTADQLDALEKGAFKDFLEKRRNQEKDEGREPETYEQKEVRLQKINDLMNNEKVGNQFNRELYQMSKQDREAMMKERGIAKKSRYASSMATKGIKDLTLSLDRYISNEIGSNYQRTQTWKTENPSYEGTGIVMKGRRREKVDDATVPGFVIYIDNSGSWQNKYHVADEALKTIKEKYADEGKITMETYYFSSTLQTEPFRHFGGTDWKAWANHLKGLMSGPNPPQNVILITDYDCDNAFNGQTFMMPGGVFHVQPERGLASNLIRHFRGKKLTEVFVF